MRHPFDAAGRVGAFAVFIGLVHFGRSRVLVVVLVALVRSRPARATELVALAQLTVRLVTVGVMVDVVVPKKQQITFTVPAVS